jgi:predicted nucleic acid-binding protein
MNYLLDVNVLVAWGWADHLDHDRVVHWIAAMKKKRNTVLFTSAIPQLGFVRVSIQRCGGQLTVTLASEVLVGMLAALGKRHRFLPDDQASGVFPQWCRAATQTTDAHLLQLANAHRLQLATLDAGISNAFLVPPKRNEQHLP